MRLEDPVLLVVEDAAQVSRCVAVVGGDLGVVELDVGLHDQGDDAGPNLVESFCGKGFAVGGDGAAGAGVRV